MRQGRSKPGVGCDTEHFKEAPLKPPSAAMMIEELEESNEACVIGERMEANVSKQLDIVSALEDSNIVVSNRDGIIVGEHKIEVPGA